MPRDTYPRLIANFPVTIYNGDWDSCVPYTDNYAWTLGMNYPVKSSWHPWQYAETTEGQTSMQVGGYAIVYQATNLKYPLTFTTVRGGRHEVRQGDEGRPGRMDVLQSDCRWEFVLTSLFSFAPTV